MILHIEGSPVSCAENEYGSELLLNEKESSRLNCGGTSDLVPGSPEDPLSLQSSGLAAVGLREDSLAAQFRKRSCHHSQHS